MKKLVKGILIIALLFGLTLILIHFDKQDEKAINNCINNGYNRFYCERLIYG